MGAILMEWFDLSTAPRDGTPVLVWHDHESDPYHLGEGKLTIYGAWCEGNGHEGTPGIYIAKLGGGYDEELSGEGWGPFVHMPDWWFKHDDPDREHPLAPTHWSPITLTKPLISELA